MSHVDDDLEPCRFCGHDQFWFAPEFSFEHSVRRRIRQWGGSALICRQCGHAEMFVGEPDTWAAAVNLGDSDIVIAGAVWIDSDDGDGREDGGDAGEGDEGGDGDDAGDAGADTAPGRG